MTQDGTRLLTRTEVASMRGEKYVVAIVHDEKDGYVVNHTHPGGQTFAIPYFEDYHKAFTQAQDFLRFAGLMCLVSGPREK